MGVCLLHLLKLFAFHCGCGKNGRWIQPGKEKNEMLKSLITRKTSRSTSQRLGELILLSTCSIKITQKKIEGVVAVYHVLAVYLTEE